MKKFFNGAIIFTVLVVLVMAGAVFEARNYPPGGRLYPWLVCSATFVLALWLLVNEVRRTRAGCSPSARTGMSMDIEASDELAKVKYGGFAIAIIWILGLWLSIWLLSWQIGISVFFILYLIFRAHARWFMIPGLVALMMLLLFYFDKFLEVFWPRGILVRLLDLPFY